MAATSDPIRVVTHVRMAPSEAFALFTEGINQWWPTDRHAVSDRPLRVDVTPGPEGRIVEVANDGAVEVWAEVEDWEPGERVVLAWHPGDAPAHATRVEARFRGSAEGCEVTVEHGGFEVLGDDAAAAIDGWRETWEHAVGFCFEQIANSG